MLQSKLNDIFQVWYADDECASGQIERLHAWWQTLASEGPKYEYFPNAAKTWLVVKPECLQSASTTFAQSGIKITAEGRPYLGSAIGSDTYIKSFSVDKISEWSVKLEKLSLIAHSHPHAAYSAFIHGVSSDWTYLMRTTPGIASLFQPLEDTIRQKLIPSITNLPPPNDLTRTLLALPTKLGGLGIPNPVELANSEYSFSTKLCEPLSNTIINQGVISSPSDFFLQQSKIKSSISTSRRNSASDTANSLLPTLPPSLRRAMELAQETGSSNWLSCIPIREFGFSLHRSAFLDALTRCTDLL